MFVDALDIDAEDRLLWFAVARRAIFDYALYRDSEKYQLRWAEAQKFIFEDDEEKDGFSFEEICALFGWDVDYVRRMTLTLNRTDVRRMEGNIRDVMDRKPEYVIPRQLWPNLEFAALCFVASCCYSTTVWAQIGPKKIGLHPRARIPI